MVYLIVFECEIGPICSSKKRAEEILDREYGGGLIWQEEQMHTGFPTILPVILDDDTFTLDKVV
jgi:hypothetical protein